MSDGVSTTTGPAALGGASARLRDRMLPRDERAFARLALLLLGLLYVNIVFGAFVRLTGSGLGCPDWPLCHGKPVPPPAYHSVIEFSNRLVGGVAIAVAAWTWLAARRAAGPTERRLALGVAALVLAQGPLGALTVLFDLHPLLVMSHFLVALAATAAGTVLWSRTWRGGDTPGRPGPWLAWLAVAVLLLGCALLVTGALSTAAGPHPGGEGVRRIGDWWVVTRTHAVVAGGYAVAVGALLLALWRGPWRPAGFAPLAAALCVLVPAQALVGEYQRLNGLPWEVVLVHVGIAGAAWVATVALCVRTAAATRPPARA